MGQGAIWTEQELKNADRLDRRARERIFAAVDRLAATGHGDVKRLRGPGKELRQRVGDWRILLAEGPVANTFLVLRVRRRDQAYR